MPVPGQVCSVQHASSTKFERKPQEDLLGCKMQVIFFAAAGILKILFPSYNPTSGCKFYSRTQDEVQISCDLNRTSGTSERQVQR